MDDSVKRMRKLREKRKQQGLCTRCGRTKDDSYSTCIKCRSEYRKNNIKDTNKTKCVRSLRKWSITNNNLYKLLGRNKLTVNQFATKVGVTLRTAERWLFEEVEPSLQNKEKINKAFGEEIFD